MAQGVAWGARELGVPCTVIVPDHAPATKIGGRRAARRQVVKVPFDRWWQVIVGALVPRARRPLRPPRGGPGGDRRQRHVGLEILEDLPDVDPCSSRSAAAGSRCGIAAGVRGPASPGAASTAARSRPRRHSRLARRRRAGRRRLPAELRRRHRREEPCLPRCGRSPARCSPAPLVSSLEEIAAAIRLLAERPRVVAEGAGAASLAAAWGLADIPERARSSA